MYQHAAHFCKRESRHIYRLSSLTIQPSGPKSTTRYLATADRLDYTPLHHHDSMQRAVLPSLWAAA